MVPPPMDVRCERCKTEYEFDDARITEAGVTVKCTTCGHVFKVKKKALVVTVPVKPGEAEAAAAAQTSVPALGANPPPAEKPREWKVRQASGNLFTFKELTTLQKWIVERKVSRDDEISLTGETWKRLGNIAELASFFQVVDEALKAAQLQALQTQGLLTPMMTPPQAPPPAAPQMPTGNPNPPVAAAPVPTPPAPPPAPPPQLTPPAPAMSQGAQMQAPSSAVGNEPRFVAHPPGAVRNAARSSESEQDPGDDLAAAGLKRSGGAGKWLLMLLLLGALGGGGYYGYFHYWLPMQQAQNGGDTTGLAGASGATGTSGAIAATGATAVTPPVPAVEDAGAPEAVAATSPGTPEVAAQDAGPEVVAAAEVDAGAPETEPVDAGVTAAVAKDEPEVVRQASTRPVRKLDFDALIAQGDRLREHERLEPALDAYGKAADLSPKRAEPYAGRGLVLLDMGQRPQAEAAFQQALKLNPRYAVAVMGLAETYRAMGRKEDAIKYYEKYLDILPNGPEAGVAKSAIQRLKE